MKKTPLGASKPAKDKDNKDTFIRFRITSEGFNRVAARAQEAGYSVGAYCRMESDKEDDGFRARRRPIAELENMTAVLGNLGSIRALHNQMAKQANLHGFDPLTFDEAQDAARQYRDFLFEKMGREAPPSRDDRQRTARREKRQATPPGALVPDSKFTGGTPDA